MPLPWQIMARTRFRSPPEQPVPIYGAYDEPAIGSQPRHIDTGVDYLPDLAKIDKLVFATLCARLLESNCTNVEFQEITMTLMSDS